MTSAYRRFITLASDEYHAMADGLADSDAETTGAIHLREWITRHGAHLGRCYVNGLRRHYR